MIPGSLLIFWPTEGRVFLEEARKGGKTNKVVMMLVLSRQHTNWLTCG
jgi:hypothetical protein